MSLPCSLLNVSGMDVSADLIELGRTPVAVVSAGVKSILDIPRTLEVLVRLSISLNGVKLYNIYKFLCHLRAREYTYVC